MPKYVMELDLTRRIREPKYGPYAYYSAHTRFMIPFGRDESVPTGKVAIDLCQRYVSKYFEEITEAIIFRVSLAGNGYSVYRVETARMFEDNYEFPLPEFAKYP
jgi:hypothetical protein